MAEQHTTTNHILVPLHEQCKEEEVNKILSKYNIKKNQLPKISVKDPAIAHLNLESGQVVKITRNGKTEPNAIFYRLVL